jgi:hypothetical protein
VVAVRAVGEALLTVFEAIIVDLYTSSKANNPCLTPGADAQKMNQPEQKLLLLKSPHCLRKRALVLL